MLKPDFIIRYDGNGVADPTRSHELVADSEYDDKELDLNRLKEIIENDPKKMKSLEYVLQYAMRFHDSLRNNGASDVVMFKCQEVFQDLWVNKTEKEENQ